MSYWRRLFIVFFLMVYYQILGFGFDSNIISPESKADSDVHISSLYYDIDTAVSIIAGIPIGTDKATFYSRIDFPVGSTKELYESDGISVTNDVITGYILRVTASNGFTTKDYTLDLNVIIMDNDSYADTSLVRSNDTTITLVDGDSEDEAFEVFNFSVIDGGTNDGKSTNISQLELSFGPMNNIDFATEVDSILLLAEGNPVNLDSIVIIGGSSLIFPIDTGDIVISDNDTVALSCKLFLNNNVGDGKRIQLFIDSSQHGFVARTSGSGFLNTFPYNIVGHIVTVDVVATEFVFSSQPSDVFVGDNIIPSVEVLAQDTNGNLDTSFYQLVTISSIGASLDLTHTANNAVNGIATFDSLIFITSGTDVQLVASLSGLYSDTSILFDVLEKPSYSLFLSEYIEGSSNNKAIEIYNPFELDVYLKNYRMTLANNGGGWELYHTFQDEAKIEAYTTYTIIAREVKDTLFNHEDADEILEYPSIVYFNGDDALGLQYTSNGGKSWTEIDIIGEPLNDPGDAWEVAGIADATKDHTLRRKFGIYAGNTNWSVSAGDNTTNSEWEVMNDNDFSNLGFASYNPSDADILTFILPEQYDTAIIDTALATVDINVINGTDVTVLIPEIDLSPGATSNPISGVSTDFTLPVSYLVTSEDGTRIKDWTVTVNVLPMLSGKAEILLFAVPDQDSVIINRSTDRIDIHLPFGTDISSLTPIIEISAGANIIPGSGVPVDFSSQHALYQVTAQDGSIKNWDVYINVHEPLDLKVYSIQKTDFASGESEYNGQLVRTIGTVTGVSNDGCFIQDSSSSWNGIYIYDNNLSVVVGNKIEVVGTVHEFNGLTELINIEEFNLLEASHSIPDPIILTVDEAKKEEYECVLIEIPESYCESINNELNNALIDDGTGYLFLNKYLFDFDIDTNVTYTVKGILSQEASQFVLLPRSDDDLIIIKVAVNQAPEISNVQIFPMIPRSTSKVYISASVTDEGSITDANLYYGTDTSVTTVADFAVVGVSDVYQGEIPEYDDDIIIYFRIKVSDGELETSYSSNYRVISTEIEDEIIVSNLKIYPNPNNGQFKLLYSGIIDSQIRIEIFDICGRLVYNDIRQVDNEYHDEILIQNPTTGIYLVRIIDGDQSIVKKFIVK